MRWLAGRLGITVPEQAWPGLIRAATFDHMQANAGQVVGTSRILKSSASFFRRGKPGAGCEILTDDEIAHYHARAVQLAPPGMLTWLHSPGHSCPARPFLPTGRMLVRARSRRPCCPVRKACRTTGRRAQPGPLRCLILARSLLWFVVHHQRCLSAGTR
jgi:hypothetical protein